MNAQTLNQKALDALSKQDWTLAQSLLFENAKKNPCHETFNNLGYYLISEGLICKNGTVRNAYKLGLKYLLKAERMKTSVVNLCALATALDYEINGAKEDQMQALYQQSYLYLDNARKLKYSDELQYNCLRLEFLLGVENQTFLNDLRKLVQTFVCEESISFYFEVLRAYNMIDECLQCIKRYGAFLDEVELLMFYAKFEFYEDGYALCKTVCNQCSVDQFIASAIIECCVNTRHFEDAVIYARKIEDVENDIQYAGKENWVDGFFQILDSSTYDRKNLIAKYVSTPSFIIPCCYYGCVMHGTNWG